MSTLMLSLNDEALLRARASVAARFQTSSDLDDFDVTKAHFEKMNSLADSQLSLAVQGKLEALKRAKDIMDESTSKLAGLASGIKRVDDRISQTNTLISNYDYLRRAHFARENITKVISQVEFFAKVPETVSRLSDTLDADPTELKQVFLQCLKLEALRQALLGEIKVSKNRRSSIVSNNNSVSEKGKGEYSSEGYSRVRSAIEQHLAPVPQLMKRIKSEVYGYIDRFMDLGVDCPQDLVMAIEIVEMFQEYLDRRADQARNKAIINDEDPDIASNRNYENMSAEVQSRIRTILLDNIEHNFEIMKEMRPSDASKVVTTLEVATQMMCRITEFKNEISPCFPAHYDTMTLLVEAVEGYVVPEINQLVGPNIPSLDVSEMLKIIDWIEYYIAQMKSYECENCKSISEFTAISEELMNEYLFRIKQQITTWFSNIEARPKEIVKTSEGLLITSHPEDMFNIIHMQIAVGKEKLPREYLYEVVNSCLQVLRDVQRQAYDKLESGWKDLDAESICAMINDDHRMQEKSDELMENTLPLVIPEIRQEMLGAMMEEVSNEYVALAVKAVGILAKSVLLDLDEPVFSKLFTSEWENGARLASILTATMDDYFVDISEWISEYFFSKFVKEIFSLTIDFYVMSIRKHANGTFHFLNELTTTAIIVKDMQIIEEFFHKFANIIQAKGTASTDAPTLLDSLQPMSLFASMTSVTSYGDAEKYSKLFFAKYGLDGLKLAQSIVLSNPGLSKSEKTQYAEKLMKVFDQGVAQGTYSNVQMEVFKAFDVHDILNKAAPKPTRRFWSR